MEIKQLFTRRFQKGQNYAQPVIYEWEDVISNEINVPMLKYPKIYHYLDRLGLPTQIFGPYKETFRYVINGKDCDEPMNKSSIVPCIIDFFEKESQLKGFYERHSKNKLVLVSSPFDYQYLKDHNCPLRVELFPYSISDKYAIAGEQEKKKYDVVLTGRQDPLLYSFFKRYVIEHPDISYVKRGRDLENDDKKTKDYYINGKECIGPIDDREDFMKLQAQGKVTLYGTQGYVEGFTKGFYHMTPHFLEIIACCNHVIAHYPEGKDGIDARFYEFGKFSKSVETYTDFEEAMNLALRTDIDVEMYSNYLKQHYTSVRVKQLQNLLCNI